MNQGGVLAVCCTIFRIFVCTSPVNNSSRHALGGGCVQVASHRDVDSSSRCAWGGRSALHSTSVPKTEAQYSPVELLPPHWPCQKLRQWKARGDATGKTTRVQLQSCCRAFELLTLCLSQRRMHPGRRMPLPLTSQPASLFARTRAVDQARWLPRRTVSTTGYTR